MPTFTTINGIDQALANLALPPKSLKSRLLNLIRDHFTDDDSLRAIDTISSDEIIEKLWEVHSPAEIRAKKKNLSSLKSAVNRQLKDLATAGQNPEGIIIDRNNLFTVSEETKDQLLADFGITGGSLQIFREMITSFRERINKEQTHHDRQEILELLKEIDEAKQILQRLGENDPRENPLTPSQDNLTQPNGEQWFDDKTGGLPVQEYSTDGVDQSTDDTIEILSDEEVEFLPDTEIDLLIDGGEGGTGETTPGTGTGSGEAVAETEEETDDTIEILSDEEVEFLPDTETDLLMDGGEGGTGETTLGTGAGSGEADAGTEEETDDTIEILSDEEVEFLPDTEIDLLMDGGEGGTGETTPGTGTGSGEAVAETEEETDDTIEILSDEEVEFLPDTETDLLMDGGEGGTGETTLGTGAGSGEADAGTEEETDDTIEILSDEEVEFLPDTEIDLLMDGGEGGTGETTPGTGTGSGEAVAETEEETDDTIEILSDEEVEFLPDTETDLLMDGGEGGTGETTPGTGAGSGEADAGTGEETDDTIEILSDEEVEFLPDTETDLLMDAGEGGTGGTTPGTGTGSGEADAGTEEETDDTIEILSDEEVEFLPDTEIDLLMGGGGGGTGETTPGTGAGSGEADAGTGEETDDTFEILSDEEVEFVDDDSSPSGVAGEKPHPPFLEIISKYLEPDETLTPDLLLTEDNDSLASILSRFTPIYIKIPAGRYPIGCPDPGPSEHPADEIILPDFFMGQYPVTNDLFELFIRETGYETDAEKAGFGIVYQGRFQSGLDHKSGKATLTIIKRGNVKKVAGADWRYPSGPAGPSIITKTNQPVVQVSHRDALAFASWAGKRLPSEEEWEAAAHGPRYSPYPWGSEWHQDFANFRSSRLGDTTPVDRNPKKAMSPFGLLDLLGNVYEWTTSHLNTAGPDRRTTWLLKGGCWNSPGPVTISHRLVESRTWSNIIGFRCAV